MTPTEKARARGWDVTPTERRNPTGLLQARLIRQWNAESVQRLRESKKRDAKSAR